MKCLGNRTFVELLPSRKRAVKALHCLPTFSTLSFGMRKIALLRNSGWFMKKRRYVSNSEYSTITSNSLTGLGDESLGKKLKLSNCPRKLVPFRVASFIQKAAQLMVAMH